MLLRQEYVLSALNIYRKRFEMSSKDDRTAPVSLPTKPYTRSDCSVGPVEASGYECGRKARQGFLVAAMSLGEGTG